MKITLTGADERTSLADLVDIRRCGAEIGLLYTFSPDGRNRYPVKDWLIAAVGYLEGKAAIHICGERARQQLYDGALDDLLDDVRRVQVNGTLEPQWLARVCAKYPNRTIITQHTPKNLWLLPVGAPNHAVLVDRSGGRGLSPSSWEKPKTDKPIGFAGGLGPDNISEQLPIIHELIKGHANGSWIDMEGKLRDEHDWFSVSMAAEVLEKWSEFEVET
jgi:hypothetical protein